MSLSSFARGLTEGIPTGIDLGNAIVSGKDRSGMRKANEIYTDLETMGPSIVTPSAIPTEGGDNRVPVGYDGVAWDERKRGYLKAIQGITDPDLYEKMERRVVDLEKSKIMEYGIGAINSLKGGDFATAQQQLAGLSYFMNPGEAPSVQVARDGTILVQQESGGYAMRPEQLEDLIHQLTDFDGWRDFTLDRKRYESEHAYRSQMMAQRVATDAAELALKEREVQSRVLANTASAQKDSVQAALAGDNRVKSQAETARIQTDTAAMAAELQRNTELHARALDEKDRKALNDQYSKANERFESWLTDPGDVADIGGDGEDTDALLAGLDEGGIPAPIEASQRTTQALGQAAREQQTAMQEGRAALRYQLEQDPVMKLAANALMTGLITGGDLSTPEEAADLAFAFTFEPAGQNRFTYDPNQGLLRVGQEGNYTYYEIGEGQRATLKALLGAAPEPQALPAR